MSERVSEIAILPPDKFISWEFSAVDLGLTQEDIDGLTQTNVKRFARWWLSRQPKSDVVSIKMTDKGPELRKEALVQCPGVACNKRERWVDWERRGDTTCGACSGKMQYTGEMRLI